MAASPKAVIIGGGLAGLSAAIRLQAQGYETTVLEKNSHLGGRMHQVKLGTHSFDFGPNTITMPHVFQEVLGRSGLNPEDYFQFIRIPRHTKNVFSDGSSFYFSSEPGEMMEELAKLDEKSAGNYPAYLEEVKKLYHLANKHVFYRTFSSWRDYLSTPLALGMLRSRPLENLDHFHRRFFYDERIIRAFNRYATYIGSSPYRVPATFGLIGYLELHGGVYYTRGGNHQIARGFVRAAQKLGVTFRTETDVIQAKVKDGLIREVITHGEESIQGDVFILNGDLLTQVPRLLDSSDRPSLTDRKINGYEPSISAFVILAAQNCRLPLHHHHVFFGEDPKKEFSDIFQHSRYGDDPTIYLCTSSKTDPDISPQGDNIFILINAPPLNKGGKAALDKKNVEERIYMGLNQRGINLRKGLTASEIVDPSLIAERFYAYRGTLYGPASNRGRDAFLRPFSRLGNIPNLYFVGGSTHPGGGSPMVVLGGQNVADLIVRNHGR